MPLASLHSPPPIRRKTLAHKPDYEVLDTAISLFGEGRYAESLQKTLEHLFANREVPDLAASTFTFPQGSSRVTVKLEDQQLSVIIPLVRLAPESNATAALRFLLTKISGTGQLHQPRLRGDDVYLEFRDRLSRLHPTKVVEVLRRMPVEADANDDWMVDQFGAAPLGRETIAPLDEGELGRAETMWRSHCREVEELLKESQRKRSMFFLNEVSGYATHHIRYALPVGGFLSTRIAEAAATFDDNEEDPMKRETALAKCAKEMLAVTHEDLAKNLGHAEYSISPLSDGSVEQLESYLGSGDYADAVARTRSAGKFMDAALALVSTYSYLLSRFSWAPAVEASLLEGLGASSDKPWREAARLLTNHGRALVELAGKEAEPEPAEEAEEAS